MLFSLFYCGYSQTRSVRFRLDQNPVCRWCYGTSNCNSICGPVHDSSQSIRFHVWPPPGHAFIVNLPAPRWNKHSLTHWTLLKMNWRVLSLLRIILQFGMLSMISWWRIPTCIPTNIPFAQSCSYQKFCEDAKLVKAGNCMTVLNASEFHSGHPGPLRE